MALLLLRMHKPDLKSSFRIKHPKAATLDGAILILLLITVPSVGRAIYNYNSAVVSSITQGRVENANVVCRKSTEGMISYDTVYVCMYALFII